MKLDKNKASERLQNLENKWLQYNLALMYESGNGIKKNIDKAIYWYEKSKKRLKYF